MPVEDGIDESATAAPQTVDTPAVRVIEPVEPDDDEDGSDPDDFVSSSDDEDEKPGAVTSAAEDAEVQDEDVDAIIARYGNDPKKLAAALKNAQSLIGRQGNKLGQLAQPAPTDQATPQLPAPPVAETPAGDEEPLFYEPPYDWTQDDIDPETGYRVTVDGVRYTPVDIFGVPYKEESYYDALEKKLAEENPDNPARVARMVLMQKQKDDEEYRAGVQAKMQQADKLLERYVPAESQAMAQRIGRTYPEPVAKELSDRYAKIALGSIRQAVAQGRLDPREAYSADGLRRATYNAMYVAETQIDQATGKTILATDAEELMKRLGNVPAAPSGRRVAPPAAPVPNGTVVQTKTADDESKYAAARTFYED